MVSVIFILSLGVYRNNLAKFFNSLHKKIWTIKATRAKAIQKKAANKAHKAITGALEMYCLDFNVDVSQVDLALMTKLRNDGYLTNLPDGVASVEVSPQGEMKYIGTDGSVIGNFTQQTWFSDTPQLTSIPSSRTADPTMAELGDITPFFATCVKKTSTFSVDVDTASYSMTVSHIKNGQLPSAESVRVEEFMNAFPQGYETNKNTNSNKNKDFTLYCDGAPSTYGGNVHMLRLGLKTRKIAEVERNQPLLITLVIDSSGSMGGNDRLGMLQQTIPALMKRLAPEDKVAIIAYSETGRTLLEPCSVHNEKEINSALNSISAGGGTNVEAGITKGYEMAALHHSKDVTSIVVLFSDGVTNSGQSNADKLMGNIQEHAKSGILLNTIGVGMGTYNDEFLERLACRGNGMYAYMNNDETATEELGKCISLTSAVVARNVRMNVEFNPALVKRYRLIGYDNRDKGEMNIENTNEEAGDVFAETETAVLYEIELTKKAKNLKSNTTLALGNATLHYLSIDGEARQATTKIKRSSISDNIKTTPYHFKLATLVAELAEILRESPYAKNRELSKVLKRVKQLSKIRPGDSQVGNLVALIESAIEIKVQVAKDKEAITIAKTDKKEEMKIEVICLKF